LCPYNTVVYIEKILRNDRTYYYVTKNFRAGSNRWRKIRRYIGDKPPSKSQINKAIGEIEGEALQRGLQRPPSKFPHLSDDEAEKLQDIKEVYNRWYGKLNPTDRRKHVEDFLVRFTYNSNAIEGNRLTLRETSMILTENIIPAGTTPNDYNEAINSKECYQYLKEYRGEFNQTFLLKIHELLTKNTDCEIVGAYRDHDVQILGSEWLPPSHELVKGEMEKIYHWYYAAKKRFHPVELGSILHNKLVRAHPFSDGNGRTSRVVMNWVLIKNDFPAFYIELSDKINYYRAIEEGDNGDDGAMVSYLTGVIVGQHTRSQEKSGAPNMY